MTTSSIDEPAPASREMRQRRYAWLHASQRDPIGGPIRFSLRRTDRRANTGACVVSVSPDHRARFPWASRPTLRHCRHQRVRTVRALSRLRCSATPCGESGSEQQDRCQLARVTISAGAAERALSCDAGRGAALTQIAVDLGARHLVASEAQELESLSLNPSPAVRPGSRVF